jgi:asparagine synthase (glutamine-hydrolysing)
MCGIAGYAYPAGTSTDEIGALLRMTRQLARRGPDDEGIALFDPEHRCAAALTTGESVPGAAPARFSGGNGSFHRNVLVPDQAAGDRFRFAHRIGMGHRRFSIIDPTPAGHQPFWSADASVCVAFNGEVYNYVELRQELERAGRRFRTQSDTEVLAEAFIHWGEECFERFVGFYAIALYDRRSEALLLARDRMGKAPLYYARRNGRLYWSSEIDGLRAGAGWNAFDVRPHAVADFVAFAYRDVHDLTFFEGIETFPRASWAWVEGDASFTPHTYWTIPTERRSERHVSSGAAAHDLRALIGDAVRLRLRADVPVGIELSGGLDSSSLVAAAANEGHRLRAFTVSFPGSEWDEAHFADAVVRRWGGVIEHNVIRPGHDDFFARADDFVGHMQEPFHSPNLFANHQIWEEMAALGLRVTITGAAGDELFGGYPGLYLLPYLSWLLERGKFLRLNREAKRFVEEPASFASSLYFSRLGKAFFHSLKRRSPFIDAFGAQRRAQALAFEILNDRVPSAYERSAPFEVLLVEKATDWLMNYWLRSTHQNNMGVPIETRNPFLDHRIVEFAFSLPVTYLIKDGWFKWILRKATRDLLPEEVTYRRRKLGFPFPIEPWLVENKEKFFSAMRETSEPCPYIEVQRLAAVYDSVVARHPMMLWRAMSVCLWWKRCVLGEELYGSDRGSSVARRELVAQRP